MAHHLRESSQVHERQRNHNPPCGGANPPFPTTFVGHSEIARTVIGNDVLVSASLTSNSTFGQPGISHLNRWAVGADSQKS